MKTNRRLPLAACFLMATLALGCAALSPVEETQTLHQRVVQYMQAHVDGKWELAYSYLDSSSRAKVTRESYVKRPRNLPYRGFAVEEVRILPAGDRATVKVKIDVRFMGYDFKGAPQTQEWVREEGEWFVQAQPPQAPRHPFGAPQQQK